MSFKDSVSTQQELQLNTARSRVTEITSIHEATERENNQLRKDKSLLVDHVADLQKKVFLSLVEEFSIAWLWNYQILVLAHGQVNGQNPLVKPIFTSPKIDIFLISRGNICCGYSLEAPHRDMSFLLGSWNLVWYLPRPKPSTLC